MINVIPETHRANYKYFIYYKAITIWIDIITPVKHISIANHKISLRKVVHKDEMNIVLTNNCFINVLSSVFCFVLRTIVCILAFLIWSLHWMSLLLYNGFYLPLLYLQTFCLNIEQYSHCIYVMNKCTTINEHVQMYVRIWP